LKEKKDITIFFSSCLFLFILGLLDDKFKINPYLRFVIFLIIFLVITQEQNLRIEYVQLSFLKDAIDLSYFSHFFTILCFLLFINAFNFFDGINLQSGIYSLILSIIICTINNNLFFFYILQIFLIIFLYLNYKNKTFLGDSGTYLLSFIFAYYFIKFYNDRHITYADEIAVLMLIPGLDLFRLFFVRIINKRNPFFPDNNHIHHLLLKKFNYLWVNFILFFLIIFSYFFYKIFAIQYLSIFFIIIIYFLLVYYFSKLKLK
jgi:UDP-N-acetylmuramyl pentapeptide phosphotransferase/UDP-N-acetylglucosamine-1-phosphate transferase